LNEHWINTDAFSYPIIIGRGSIKRVGHIIREKNFVHGEKIALITSNEVFKYWGDDISGSFTGTALDVRLITIPDGEEAKEFSVLDRVYDGLVRFGMHRDGLIVGLGGGSVSDVAGFVASTYLRGIDYINVPTTLLAQIDSCVGGKTGINHVGGKNLIGAFWQPRGVIVDPDIIETLELRQILSGLSEAIKVSVIADEDLFNFIEENFDGISGLKDSSALDKVIERALMIKAQVVEADEKETSGYRIQLNFGHTFGHAYEASLREMGRPISHGEAVAIGMLVESHLALQLGMLGEIEEARIAAICRKIIDPSIIRDLPWNSVFSLLNIDKKSRDDGIYFVLPTSIGSVQLAGNIDEETMRAAAAGITGPE
jgi:3-dehydroquinate synthase